MTNHAIVLYGRAGFDTEQNVRALAAAYEARFPDPACQVAVAFADLTGPSLPAVLDQLAQEGVTAATVVTCMVPADPTHAAWLPGALSAWRSGAAIPIDVRIAPAVETVLDIVGAIKACVDDQQRRVATADVEPSMGKPGWSNVPEHGRQLFFCTGARCLHRGADALFQHLRATMKPHRSLNAGPRRVMCARSSCLYPCNKGPLMAVWPDGIWYGSLDPSTIDEIVRDHLLDDLPVSRAIVHRPS